MGEDTSSINNNVDIETVTYDTIALYEKVN